jgi:hypothetical protein
MLSAGTNLDWQSGNLSIFQYPFPFPKERSTFPSPTSDIEFIVDFYWVALLLVIEIDGQSHSTEQGKQYNAEITGILQGYGWIESFQVYKC